MILVRSPSIDAAPAFPASLLPASRGLPFVCPICKLPLDVRRDAYHCRPCERIYLLYAGVPDFRILPDPFLSDDEDRRRADFVIEQLDKCNLATLLERYWELSDVTPLPLRARFIRGALFADRKSERTLDQLQGDTFRRPIGPVQRALDIGCGTGGFLKAATRRGLQVVGIDIAMRWLHVSRKRFLDAGLSLPPLVCCNAEYLPFPDGYFDLVTATSVLEFAHDVDRCLSDTARVLSPTGELLLHTVNRYSIAADPYTSLYGVGYLPRRWQAAYVYWRMRANHQRIRPLSLGELQKLVSRHFGQHEFVLPDIDNESLREFSFSTRLQVHAYRALRRLPGSSWLLKRFGPAWDVKLGEPRKGSVSLRR